jgi:hypothetical protein
LLAAPLGVTIPRAACEQGVNDMPSMRAFALVIAAIFLASCASSYEVVRMPQRDADLYPLSQTKSGVTIAIDEIKGAMRAERYFGADLIREGVLPVTIIVSNYGEQPVTVKPSDVLLHRGREILDPLPVEAVVAIAKRQRWFLRAKTEEQIDQFFDSVVFTETALLPSETYQGVMFFPIPRPPRTRDRFFTVLSLFREGGPKVRVGVTNQDTRDRLHFGPFSLSLPEERASQYY